DSLERTLVLIKPDAVQRGLIGLITHRFEARGLKLVGAKLVNVDQQLAEEHYAVHKGKLFYEGLIQYITSAPVMAMVWEGPSAISAVRQTMGATKPTEASPGSIRHDFGLEVGRNLTHGSDAPETAQQEIELWFSKQELIDWDRSVDTWIFEE
ncbi:MAG: nucleoside-diphosphate kinase, partial [Anaerolineales bacterium]